MFDISQDRAMLLQYCRQDFSVDGFRQIFGGPVFNPWEKIMLLVEALKIGVIIQKCSLKLVKIWKVYEETFREKCKKLRKYFQSLRSLREK